LQRLSFLGCKPSVTSFRSSALSANPPGS